MKKMIIIIISILFCGLTYSQTFQQDFDRNFNNGMDCFRVEKFNDAFDFFDIAAKITQVNDWRKADSMRHVCEIRLKTSYTHTNQNEIHFPSEIFSKKHLIYIDLSNNNIVEIPDEIAGLTNLRTLILNDNNISELSKSLIKLDKLEILFLKNNNLHEFPYFINSISSLKWIDFSGNNIDVVIASKITLDLNFDSWILLGDMMIDKNKPKYAYDLYQKAAIKDNNRWEVYRGLGNVSFIKQKYFDALRHYLFAQKRSGNQCVVCAKNLGLIYYHYKKYDSCIVKFDEYFNMTKIVENSVYLKTAEAYYYLENYQQSIKYLKKYSSLSQSRDTSFLHFYAKVFCKNNNFQQEDSIYQILSAIQPSKPEWKYYRALSLLNQARYNNLNCKYDIAINLFDEIRFLDLSTPEIKDLKRKSLINSAYANLKVAEIDNKPPRKDVAKNLLDYLVFRNLKSVNNYYMVYACYYSYTNSVDTAFIFLNKAIDAGYNDDEFVETETLLKNLRNYPEFEQVIIKVKQN